jgi:hypothetical protein
MPKHCHNVVAVLFLAVLTACAAFASKQEYWLYRQLMETKDMEEKAELYREYVTDYPSGAFAGQMKDVEQEIEFAVYNATGQDKDKIAKYLELFPKGRFTADASDKLAQLEAIEKIKSDELAAQKMKKEELEALANEKKKKFTKEITGAMADWTAISISTFVYGISVNDLATASARFKELWGSEPLAECGTEVCLKTYELAYHFQVLGATRIDRIIRMVVMVRFREGKIWGMSVNFPGRGFIGLRELIEDQPRDTNEQELADSADFTAALLESTLQSAVPAGKAVEKEGMLFAYESPGANYYLVRTSIGQAGVVDSFVIQLLPPPPPGQEPGKIKKPKKVKTPSPENPVITVEELVYIPQAPSTPAPKPAPVEPPAAPPPAPAAAPAAAPLATPAASPPAAAPETQPPEAATPPPAAPGGKKPPAAKKPPGKKPPAKNPAP